VAGNRWRYDSGGGGGGGSGVGNPRRGALNTEGGGGGGDRRRRPHGRTNRTDTRTSATAQLPHPRNAAVSRFRLVSSILHALARARSSVNRPRRRDPSSLSRCFPRRLCSFSPSRSESAPERRCITAGQTMRIATQTRARHTGRRDEERKSYGITTSRVHLSRLAGEERMRERDSEGRRRNGRRKNVETPAVTHARALRHFDTSDTSSFSPVTPNPRFLPHAPVPSPLSLSPLAHTLHTHSRILGRAAYLQRERVEPIRLFSRQSGLARPSKSIPFRAEMRRPRPVLGQASLDRLPSFRPSRSSLSLVTARREFSSTGLCASSDGDCAPKPKQRTTLPSGAPLAVAPPIRRTRRLAQRAWKRALRARTEPP